jgi:hypothetical protein
VFAAFTFKQFMQRTNTGTEIEFRFEAAPDDFIRVAIHTKPLDQLLELFVWQIVKLVSMDSAIERLPWNLAAPGQGRRPNCGGIIGGLSGVQVHIIARRKKETGAPWSGRRMKGGFRFARMAPFAQPKTKIKAHNRNFDKTARFASKAAFRNSFRPTLAASESNNCPPPEGWIPQKTS